MARPKMIHQMTIPEFDRLFPDEEACCRYLVDRRWPDGVKCPRCGDGKVTELKNNPWRWQCYACAPTTSYRFSHIAGTIFENTNKPLRDWFRVLHMMVTSKKGVSALQVQRVMGFGSYATAWSMCHRIRAGMADEQFKQLVGYVEVDETFVGGKDRNKHKKDRGGKRGGKGKMIVAGAIQRGGNVVARVIERADTLTLLDFVRTAVSHRVSLLSTDDYHPYRALDREYPHGSVRHSKGEYVVGALHTSTIDSFWSMLKRGVMGTFHKVTKKYLPLYVAEFEFRYNNRENADIFGAAIGTV